MKILDTEFRKELYKSLMEAGYDKNEAQKIVAVKYFTALKFKVQESLSTLSTEINENQFAPLDENFVAMFNTDIQELMKMHKIINSGDAQ
jgi:hypothetical protein